MILYQKFTDIKVKNYVLVHNILCLVYGKGSLKLLWEKVINSSHMNALTGILKTAHYT